MSTATVTRNDVTAEIRRHLHARSDRRWSVRAGKGTAWGWITITAPPARLDQYGAMNDLDRAALAKLLGVPTVEVHCQGYMVEPGAAAYRDAIERAAGRKAGSRYLP